MTITEMLGQSGLLTLLGMCVVFSFIIIMILGMKLLQVTVRALKLDKDKTSDSATVSASAANAFNAPVANNDAVVAAIAAAVHDKVLNS